MRRQLRLFSVPLSAATLFAVAALLAIAPATQAAKRTVCTVTVNSADEREVFKKRLPEGDYDFIELVERGRPDWLASACRQGVRCDVLVVSGHFDGMTEFYSDRLAMRESLPVVELERASCSESCPGVFAQLKEVYLFGCNTMNAEPVKSTTAEAARSLVRSGMSPADASRVARGLDSRHAESSRDHMRRIFTNVPAIYGFTKLAPLGPTAATLLNKYFDQAAVAEVGRGRADPKLLAQFAASKVDIPTFQNWLVANNAALSVSFDVTKRDYLVKAAEGQAPLADALARAARRCTPRPCRPLRAPRGCDMSRSGLDGR